MAKPERDAAARLRKIKGLSETQRHIMATRKTVAENIIPNADFRNKLTTTTLGVAGLPPFWYGDGVIDTTIDRDTSTSFAQIVKVTLAPETYIAQYIGLCRANEYAINPCTPFGFRSTFGLTVYIKRYSDVELESADVSIEIHTTSPTGAVGEITQVYEPTNLWYGFTLDLEAAEGVTEAYIKFLNLNPVSLAGGPPQADAVFYLADLRGHTSAYPILHARGVSWQTESLTFGLATAANGAYFNHQGITTTASLQPTLNKRGFCYALTLEPGTVPGGDEVFQVVAGGTVLLSATYSAGPGGRQTTLFDFSAGLSTLVTESTGFTVKCVTADGSPGQSYLATVSLICWAIP